MKQVKFVRVKSNLSGYGLVKGYKFNFEDVEPIIKKNVEDGWDYKGFVPVGTRMTGDIEEMSLVFEKEE
jgi:hypothetical protein